MKKIITLTLVSIVSLFFVGCEKEKEEFSLVGKTYAGFVRSTPNFDVYNSWRFISETEVEQLPRKDAPNGNILQGSTPEMGSYILNYPKLTVKINENYTGEQTYECEFINETCLRVSMPIGRITEFNQQ